MKDLRLDENTHDLYLDDQNDFDFVTEADYIRQKLEIKLALVRGEWSFDVTKGIPYYEYILGEKPNLPLIEALIKAAVLETPGVLDIVNFQTLIDKTNRVLQIVVDCNTDLGELISVNTEIGI